MKTLLLAALFLTGLNGTRMSLEEHPWRRWKEGAWIKAEIKNGDLAMVTEKTLLGLDEERYRLKSVMRMPGIDDMESEISFPYAFLGNAHFAPRSKEVGKESVEVGGRSYTCTVFEFEYRDKGEKHLERAWMTDGVKAPLKIVSDSPGVKVELTATDLSDKVLVGKSRVDCVRYRGKLTDKEKTSYLEQWTSLRVPGGIVRMVGYETDSFQDEHHRFSVVAYRGRQR